MSERRIFPYPDDSGRSVDINDPPQLWAFFASFFGLEAEIAVAEYIEGLTWPGDLDVEDCAQCILGRSGLSAAEKAESRARFDEWRRWANEPEDRTLPTL
jgi:hypothetical protein